MTKKINQTFVTKNEIVYNNIKEQILTGALMPGERITVMQCAEQYGVSAMPIREALKRLQQEGLVNIVPHAGAQVVKFDNRKFCEITEIRNVLEPYAAKLAVKHLTEHDLHQLSLMLDKMRVCVEKVDRVGYSELNTKFHAYIYDRCNNTTLLETINSLWEKSRISKNIFMMDTQRMALSYQEHLECFELIKKRDADGVQAALKAHKEHGFAVVEHALNRISEHT